MLTLCAYLTRSACLTRALPRLPAIPTQANRPRLLAAALSLLSASCSPMLLAESTALPGHTLTIVIKGYEQQQGTTYFSLYDNAEAFNQMSGQSVANLQHRVNGDTLRISFHDLPSSHYAVSLFHDANSNRELDRNILGIPSEPYGFSNDAGAFGPAKFDKASFELAGDRTIVINLR